MPAFHPATPCHRQAPTPVTRASRRRRTRAGFIAALAMAGALQWTVCTAATPAWVGLSASHTYTPTSGETLDRIVAKTLPNSPLSAELLGQAFVSLNPQAFSTGKTSRTLSTATLKVPNHNQLVQLVLAKNEALRPAVLAALSAQEALVKPVQAPVTRAGEKRENWVRYAGGPVKPTSNFDGSAPERKGWVHYLGAAVQRALGATGLSPEVLRWVHYPRVNIAAEAGTPSTLSSLGAATLPEGSADTRNWVRYSAGRHYPAQQLAQLFD